MVALQSSGSADEENSQIITSLLCQYVLNVMCLVWCININKDSNIIVLLFCTRL